MFLPKRKGNPQSKSPNEFPPISEKTLLDELVRPARLPIRNEAIPLGDPEAPVFMAEKPIVDEGQNQLEFGLVHSGSTLAEGEGKKRPFEPVSIKLLYKMPLKVVVNSPY